MPLPTTDVAYIRWFAELGLDNISLVGGKNASLGEMYRTLSAVGVRVPPGFAITADAYREFLHAAHLDQKIAAVLKDLHPHDIANLRQRGRQVRQAMLAAPLPAAPTMASAWPGRSSSSATPSRCIPWRCWTTSAWTM